MTFDHDSGELVVRRVVEEVPETGERFPSVDSWWDRKRMSLLMNSCINIWLNLRGARDATEEGMHLETALTNVPDEVRYSDELQRALRSAQGSHLNPDEILLKVKQEARKVAIEKRTRVSFVGEYLLDFVQTLGDAYGLSERSRERLRQLASYSKLR